MTASSDASKVRLERARRVVFGRLAPALLHETNNVLTVMAGVRQLMRSGQPLSERIGSMIDQQLAKMDELVGAMRRLAREESEPDAAPRDLGFVLDAVEPIVKVAGKGRGLAVARAPGDERERPDHAEPLGLATLCLLLPRIPERGRGGSHLSLCGRASPSSVGLEVALDPVGDEPDDDESALARALLEDVGGSLVARREGARFVAELTVPRAAIG